MQLRMIRSTRAADGGEVVAVRSADGTADRRRIRLWTCLVLLLLVAVALRAGFAVLRPVDERPDEIFQTLEPAHRILTGWGIVSWEWREGIRSWVVPEALAAVMRAGFAVGLPARFAVPLVWLALSALASLVVVAGVWIGWRKRGLTGALLCGLLCAVWPDLVYFGPKTLTEVQSGNLAVLAAAIATLLPGASPTTR